MSKRLDKILAAGVAALTVTCSAAVLASCQDDSVEGYTVTFVTDGGTSYGKIETQAPGQAIVLSVPENTALCLRDGTKLRPLRAKRS